MDNASSPKQHTAKNDFVNNFIVNLHKEVKCYFQKEE